ncbi:MAG: hypothetical protein J7604_00725 [Sporocytophaga sp.]|uniref:hypothetical protein n=1 Tax=Sporocytophaga sp. TaxID=2231183 RepID=UPI001B03DB43|nr:hypothetical protein [Sporocytophaga sp.]MBO9698694.1 hypothetical protein [Sporocytophaga sp.]
MEINIKTCDNGEAVTRKNVEIIKVDGKIYVQMDNLDHGENLMILADSLSAEMVILQDRIRVLEERLRMLESNSGTNF